VSACMALEIAVRVGVDGVGAVELFVGYADWSVVVDLVDAVAFCQRVLALLGARSWSVVGALQRLAPVFFDFRVLLLFRLLSRRVRLVAIDCLGNSDHAAMTHPFLVLLLFVLFHSPCKGNDPDHHFLVLLSSSNPNIRKRISHHCQVVGSLTMETADCPSMLLLESQWN